MFCGHLEVAEACGGRGVGARLHQVLHLVRDGGEGRVIQLRHLHINIVISETRETRVYIHVSRNT